MDGSSVEAPESHRIGSGAKFNRTLASRSRGQVVGLTREDATDDEVDRSLYSIKFFVHHWKARRRQLKQSVKEEVQKRRKLHGADLSDSDFVPQPVMLRDLHMHTESAVDRALNHMAQTRRHGMLQSQAGMVQRLLYVLEALGRLGAVHVESQLCIEVSAMLSDVLMGSSCDFYPVASANDAGRFETFVLVGCKRVPINVKHTAFLGRIAARSARGGDRNATIISDPAAEIRDGANHVAGRAPESTKVAKGAALPLHTATFYDTGVGMRELLVRREQDTGLVAATLRERGYATAGGSSLEPTEVAQARLARRPRSPAQPKGAHRGLLTASAELGRCRGVAQVLVLPVFKPRRWVPLTKDAADGDDDGGDDDGGDGDDDDDDMVAILQLVRQHGAPPLNDDDAYLCELLAPHLAHALAGAQGVESRKATSEQYQHILGTAQTLGKAKDSKVPHELSPGLGGGERTELQTATASADSVRHALAPLSPPKQAEEKYSLERLRAAMRGLFACDDALLYIPRDPSAVLKASQRGTGTKRRSGVTPAFATVDQLDRAKGRPLSPPPATDRNLTMVPLLPEGVRSRTGLASVSSRALYYIGLQPGITYGCSVHQSVSHWHTPSREHIPHHTMTCVTGYYTHNRR